MTRGPRRVSADTRREQLLEAARSVALERGIAHTRVADVADALGISTALVHYHFGSKDALLAETLARVARTDIARMTAAADAVTDSVERLEGVILEYLPTGPGDPSWRLWVEAWGDGLRTPAIRDMSEELDRAWVALMERVIRLGVEDGTFDCKDTAGAAWRLAALLDGLGVQLVVHPGAMTREDAVGHARAFAHREFGIPGWSR